MATPRRPEMSTATPLPTRLCFGRFELRQDEHRLLADGEPVALGGRAFELLLALARRQGQLVTRNELIEAVWPGRVVEENNLSVQVNALRKVLGGEWLLTVPGRGYRFVAPAGTAPPAAGVSPPTAPRGLRTHLPVLPPLLIGRSDDLAALGTLVDQHRLVTIVGAGGIGKTRLAGALLGLRAGTLAQGVCWVELGSLSTAEALAAHVAAALELSLPPGDAMANLALALREVQMLVALDNAEHLLEAVAQLAQALLDAAPGLRLLVTSQAPLRLASERVLRLGPLAMPQGVLPAREAQTFGAVALFCDRAAAADHRFVLAEADVPLVIELCRRLDGLALAIELAAARAPALGLGRLLAALDDRLQLLRLGRNRQAPPRQQSLRAALEWSVGLLAPAEQQLFRCLGVLVGSATLEMVLQIAGADADPWPIVDALDQLVQRSLVEVVVTDDLGVTRYRLLESPRALALSQLAGLGEEALVRERHAQAVRSALELAGQALLAGRQDVDGWRRDTAHLHQDALQGLAFARATRRSALAFGLARALLDCLPDPRHVDTREAVRTCEEQLEAAECVDDRLACRAWLVVSLVGFQGSQRSPQAATRALQRLQCLGDTDDDRFLRYATLCEASRVRAAGGLFAQAQALLDQARALEGDDWPAVRRRVLPRASAFLAMARGQPDEALRDLKQALSWSLAAGDPSHATRLNIADMELAAGLATAAVQRGRALVQELSGRRALGLLQMARLNLAAAHLSLQQPGDALPLLQTAWQASRSQGRDWVELAQCLDLLAWLCAQSGRRGAAAQLLGAADARYHDRGGRRYPVEKVVRESTLALLATGLAASGLAALQVQGREQAEAGLVTMALAGLGQAPDRPAPD